MGNKFVVTVVNVANYLKNKTHEVLDYCSIYLCSDKPTYKLATDNLHIPEEDLTVLMQIFNMVRDALGLAIVPFKMLSDKKFSVHIYETATVFASPNNPQPQNTVTTCDKMLMYIAHHRNKIAEPASKQVLKTTYLHNDDYDLPVNFWYTFNIDNLYRVHIFVHISTIQNYKGVVVASGYNDNSNLTRMKQEALDYYDHTLGRKTPNVIYNIAKRLNFL